LGLKIPLKYSFQLRNFNKETPKSSKTFEMLVTSDPFYQIFRIFKVYGLEKVENEKKWKKVVKVMAFLVFFVLCFTLLVLDLVVSKTNTLFFEGLTFVPVMLILFVKAFNIYFRVNEIKNFLHNTSEVYQSQQMRVQLEKSLKVSNLYFKVSATLSVVTQLLTSISTIVSGVFSPPLFIPKFIVDAGLATIVNFTLQFGLSVYCTFLFLPLDTLSLCCLIMLHGCVKNLRKEIGRIENNKESLKNCVEYHIKLMG
jgi:hypothetical protein